MTAGGGGAGDSISHFAETVPAVGEEGEQGVCGGVGSLGLQEGSRLAVGRRVQLQTDCAGSSTSSPPCWVSAFSSVWWRQRLQDEKSLGLLVALKDSCSLAKF